MESAKKPAGQTLHNLEAGFECLPASHASQRLMSKAPMIIENVPAGQLEQFVDAIIEVNDPAGQGLHAADDVRLVMFDAVPTGHGVHVGDPELNE